MADIDRIIKAEIVVAATPERVWDAWTTEAGVKSFFAPACNIDIRVGGPYEILFDLDAAPGEKGGEGVKILAVQPPKMLSFTWNAPPHLPNVRQQHTHVVVRLNPVGNAQTQVTLHHDGWGEGEEWGQAFAYFSRAWPDVVLPRLKYRFAVGPVDWGNPPQLS